MSGGRRLDIKASWVCWNHGKAPHYVPISQVRCPDCILRHHEDRERFSLSCISVRPDYQEPVCCPSCENLQRRDLSHLVFKIPADLVRFYLDGVEEEDSASFKAIAREAGLLEDFLCPQCGTALIPVDHRRLQGLTG